MLSIIIPTLNESEGILGTIRMVHERASGLNDYEVFVIDAGSTDDTTAKLQQAGIRFEQKAEFKGLKYKSLNYGTSRVQGQIFLFLDADCEVPPFFDQLIFDAVRKPQVVGGAFEYRSANRTRVYRLIELINRTRYRLDGYYFGDQGLFCTRKAFESAGGYPDEPLMESAHICRSLRKLGKLALIRQPIITSARRFERGGPWRVFFHDTIIWLRFLVGLDVKKYASGYWGENESEGM